jgi:hypothetical protein
LFPLCHPFASYPFHLQSRSNSQDSSLSPLFLFLYRCKRTAACSWQPGSSVFKAVSSSPEITTLLQGPRCRICSRKTVRSCPPPPLYISP